jgi:HEAT repeat protein
MRATLALFVLLLTPAGVRAGSGGGADAWSLIETDMHNAGCFKAPVATVRDALHSEDAICRFQAARVVGLQGDRKAVPELKTLQERDPDPGVRRQATIELVRLGESDYLPSARRLLEETPSLGEKVLLAGQLAELGDLSGSPYVGEACRSADPQLRRSCVSVLWFFRKPAARDAELRADLVGQMLALAEDQDAGIRQSSLYALATFGREMVLPAEAVARLESIAAESRDPQVKQTARTVVDDQKRKQHEPTEQQR